MEKANITYRSAKATDVPFMSKILVDAARASGVNIPFDELAGHPDTYQYIEGFPKDADTGIIAETREGVSIGCAWVRLLSTEEHSIRYQLPETTIGVLTDFRRMGIGAQLMNKLYKEVYSKGIREISLGVHKENIPAINLYQKQKWVKDGTFREYIMMSRKIDSSQPESDGFSI